MGFPTALAAKLANMKRGGDNANSVEGATAATQIATIPIATTVQVNFPIFNGIVMTGAGPGSIAY